MHTLIASRFIGALALLSLVSITAFADTSSQTAQDADHADDNAGKPPVVSIVTPLSGSTYFLADTVLLSGHASDPEGEAMTYSWYSEDATVPFATSLEASFVGLVADGDHVFTFEATDGRGNVSSTKTTIQVDDQATLPLHADDTWRNAADGDTKEYYSTESDLSGYLGVKATVHNTSNERCRVRLIFGTANQTWHRNYSSVVLEAGQTRDVTVFFTRDRTRTGAGDWWADYESYFDDMWAAPGGSIKGYGDWDFDQTKAILTFEVSTANPVDLQITNMRAYGTYQSPSEVVAAFGGIDHFYPFVDEFGQYKHATWPGKITGVADFVAASAAEARELADHPRPANRNRFGSWVNGPAPFTATGRFEVEKYQVDPADPDSEVWTFIDPEGHLFWSYGATDVKRYEGKSKVSGRHSPHPKAEDQISYFENLPERSHAAFGDLYRLDPQFGAGVEAFAFGTHNLMRKYRDPKVELVDNPNTWRSPSRSRMLHRTLSWGFNTLGCWSDRSFYHRPKYGKSQTRPEDERVPYTHDFSAAGVLPYLYDGMVGFPDPWGSHAQHGSFEASVERALALEVPRMDSEWCIGFFFLNEIDFRRGLADRNHSKFTRVADAYIKQPDGSPQKEAIMNFLFTRHGGGEGVEGDLASLNATWYTDFSSWAEVRALKVIPRFRRNDGVSGPWVANPDGEAFEAHYMTEFYGTVDRVAGEVFAAAGVQEKLFLGSRFINYTPRHMVEAAARIADVTSINWYKPSPDHLMEEMLPADTDVDPAILIGEFHFGALDRGYFWYGLESARDQADRAIAFREYYSDALRNRNIVGAHWFSFAPQPITGRKDGEAAQIGLVDIADNPYPETVQAAREVGAGMYEVRYAGGE